MNGWEFVASIIGSIAWPATVVGLAVVFRKPLVGLLQSDRLQSLEVTSKGLTAKLFARDVLEVAAAIEERGTAELVEGEAVPALAPASAADIDGTGDDYTWPEGRDFEIYTAFHNLNDRLVRLITLKTGERPKNTNTPEMLVQAVFLGLIDEPMADVILELIRLYDRIKFGFVETSDLSRYTVDRFLSATSATAEYLAKLEYDIRDASR